MHEFPTSHCKRRYLVHREPTIHRKAKSHVDGLTRALNVSFVFNLPIHRAKWKAILADYT